MKNKKIKIAMVAPMPPPYGGIANWAVMLSEYSKNQEDVELVYINIAPKKRGLDGRTLWDRVVGQGFAMFAQKRQLKRAIKQEKIDVIHMTTSGQLAIVRDILMLKLARKKKIPSVYHIRFGRIPEIAKNNTLEWKLLKRAMRLADKVMAIDNQTYSAIQENAKDVKICCVPNPFDETKLPKEIDGLSNQPEIVYVGWVIKTKGIEELLLAWQEVKNNFPAWRLRLVGPYDNEYYQTLKNNFSLEQVSFEGEQEHEQAMKILSQASVFILPSYTEGFPNSVLEAMALQKPIVATDVGAIPDILKDCGLVIPSKDVNAIVEALNGLLSNEQFREELGYKGREKLLREYTLETVFEEYMRVWREVQ